MLGRLHTYRDKKIESRGVLGGLNRSQPEAKTAPLARSKAEPPVGEVKWIAVAQIVPSRGTESSAANPSSPELFYPEDEANPRRGGAGGRGKQITIAADLQYGSDTQSVLVVLPEPFLAQIKRQVFSTVITAQYPLAPRTNLALSVPYISQTTRGEAPGASIRQSGRGLGDVGVFLEQRFPEIARGAEVDITLGMLFPTGTDSNNLAPNELPTGVGFYQPLARVRISKMRVPLQIYTAFDYGTSLARNVNGVSTKLPVSVGIEAGFYYAISPEFTAQTALKWSRISSPFVFENASNVGYLSQSLTYNTGANTALQASVDAGLTPDALDFFFSLSLLNRF